MPRRLDFLLTSCLSVAVPFRCPICGKPPFDGSPGMFCADCLESLPFIAPPFCPGCGGPMDGILDVCPKCLRQPSRPSRGQAQTRTAVSRRHDRAGPASLDAVPPARIQSGRPDLPGHLGGTRRAGGPGAPPGQAHPSAGAADPQGKNFKFNGRFFADGFDKMRKACYINCRRCFDDGRHARLGGVRPA